MREQTKDNMIKPELINIEQKLIMEALMRFTAGTLNLESQMGESNSKQGVAEYT